MNDYIQEQRPDNFEQFQDMLGDQLGKADHFYIIHYCKKRDEIEERRCYWDEKSKIWITKAGKIAITCVALDNEEHTIDGYRTFTNIFTIKGYTPKVKTSEEIH